MFFALRINNFCSKEGGANDFPFCSFPLFQNYLLSTGLQILQIMQLNIMQIYPNTTKLCSVL
jgi:hypothetical protein